MEELETALKRLSEIQAKLNGNGGNDKVTKRDLEAAFVKAAHDVADAFIEAGSFLIRSHAA